MYIEELIERLPVLAFMEEKLRDCIALMEQCYQAGGKIMTCGNGGSAADAEHIVGEMMKGFILPRPLSRPMRERLWQYNVPSEIIGSLQMAIPCISLVSGVSLPTAFANDINGEYVFAQQVFALGKQDDILLAISTSGNSPNIIAAVKVARAKGVKIIGLTGNPNDNLLYRLSDVALSTPTSRTPLVQEFHLAIYHAVCAQLEHKLFGDSSRVDETNNF